MHILIFTSQYTRRDPKRSRTFVQQQALALTDAHQVTVIAPELVSFRASSTGQCRPEEEKTGTVYRPQCRYLLGVWWFFYLISSFRCASQIDWTQVDVVHAHWSLPSGFTAALLARRYRKPFVLTEHRGDFEHLIKPVARRMTTFWTIKQASTTVVVSQSLKKTIEKTGLATKLAIVPNIVDPNVFRPAQEARSPGGAGTRLLWVGSFDRPHIKGVDVLLGSMSLVRERLPEDISLTLVGDGAYHKESKSEAERLGIDEICNFVGAVPHHHIVAWMQRCDALVLSSRLESFGVVLIEAMACGKPVVATRCGGPEDIVTAETGILVRADDQGALAGGITQLCEAYERYDPVQIAEYARARFSPDRVATMLTSIYKEVLDADPTA